MNVKLSKLDKAGLGSAGYGLFSTQVKPKLFDNSKEGELSILRLPLMGSMQEFEEALFRDVGALRFVEVVLSTQSIAPWSVAADYAVQFAGFVDMVNDINGTDDMKGYLENVSKTVKEVGASILSGDPNRVSLGFTLIFDPRDAILPLNFSQGQSMSLINQLNYKVSVSRIKRFAKRHYFNGGDLVIEFIT